MCTYFPNAIPGEKYRLPKMTPNKGINELILINYKTKFDTYERISFVTLISNYCSLKVMAVSLNLKKKIYCKTIIAVSLKVTPCHW